MTTTPTPEQRWRRFAAALHQADRAGDVPLDGLQIADLLWMAKRLSASLSAEQQQSPTSTDPGGAGENPPQPTTPDPRRHISPDPTAGSDGTTKTTAATATAGDHDPKADVDPMVSTEASAADRLRLAVAEPGLLPQRRRLGRALAPLNRWVYTGPARDLDVPATVEEIARARAERRPWRPVLRPRRQAWLALHLVFDGHTSMVVWERLQRELPRCLSQQVRWRDLRCWTLSRNPSGSMELRGANGRPPAPPAEAAGRARPCGSGE